MIIQDKYQPARLGREILNTECRIQNWVSSYTKYPSSLFFVRGSGSQIIKSAGWIHSFRLKNLFIFILSLILNLNLNLNLIATTHTVNQDGTGDYTLVQEAIDAASNGDTVLVWPGTYFENLHIDNKNLTIGSLTLTTGDLGYMHQTIIDGNHTGSCFFIENCQPMFSLNGFMLINGSGTWYGYISGGAMAIMNSFVNILNCVISDNKAFGYGGGV